MGTVLIIGTKFIKKQENCPSVLRRPKEVALGIIGYFIIMPLLAFLLTVGLDLPKEVAVGVILVDCCPSGTASNVMVFLARGNVAMEVGMQNSGSGVAIATAHLSPLAAVPSTIFSWMKEKDQSDHISKM